MWWQLSVQNVDHRGLKLDSETLGSAACKLSSGIKQRPEAEIFQPLVKPTLPARGLPARAKESGAPPLWSWRLGILRPRLLGFSHQYQNRATAAESRFEFLRQG